jgi:hypothetical protein
VQATYNAATDEYTLLDGTKIRGNTMRSFQRALSMTGSVAGLGGINLGQPVKTQEFDCGCTQKGAVVHRCPKHNEIVPFNPSIAPAGEIRVVDPKTGGMKGSKLARFDMIPPDVLQELAEHYGKGESKYPSDENNLPNWMRGYGWRLSIAALERHLNAWKAGEDVDEETGSSHLIACLWHLFALRTFQKHALGTDDRLFQVMSKKG